MDETRTNQTQAEAHDLFECPNCLEAGQKIRQAVARIERWSGALTELAPPAVIEEGEQDPIDVALPGDLNLATLTEGLAHAIFYEVERLRDNLPSRVLCEEEWERLRDSKPRPRGPLPVAR